MLPDRCILLGLQFVTLLLPPCANAAMQQNETSAAVTVLRIDALGAGMASVGGEWQFHVGDDPAWADPSLDDSRWEQLTADRTWGSQRHPGYIGYAWYRRHLDLRLAPGTSPNVALLIPPIQDAVEVYWNGHFAGRYGKLPPHPVWYYQPTPQTFGLGQARSGVLALRVWKAPLESFDPETLGGLTAAPLLGSPESIADAKAAADYTRLRSHQVAFGLDALYTLVASIGLLFWLRDRRQRLIFWMLIFAGSSAIFDCLVPLGPQLPSNWAIGAAQPLLGIISVATWFVLILLLELEHSPWFVKLIRILTLVQMLGCCLLGIEVVAVPFVPNGGQPVLQWIDGILTALFISLDTVPIFLVLYGVLRRGRLSVDRWAVAACAFLADGIPTARIAFAQGTRFTHWTISARIAAPLFVVRGSPVNAQTIAQILLLAAVVYAAWRYTAEESRRRVAIDRELENAREVQQLLVPTAIPQVAGFILTSNYRPAQEVGGDFFQIIPVPEQEGSSSDTLVVLGDVSGKGVKAAMAVSLIVGALRMAAETISKPAQILAALNRRLCGRMAGGFATAVALCIDADGRCVIASAGHNPPLINGEEFGLVGSLPLGLDPRSVYEETQLFLRSGDRLALYTDGLVEARNASGELFGFDRLRNLFSRSPTAEQATDAAIAFGQEDDITVVTLTRCSDQDQVAESVQTPGLSPLPA